MLKNEYIQQLLIQAPSGLESETAINTDQWWWIATEDNWRLSWHGYDCLTKLKLESWEFDFVTKEIKPWIYLTLSRKLQAPYYIVDNKKHAKLVIFDSQSAVMINLYGNLIRWIESINH